MNYYERHLGDYAKDTAHLSMLEHGAYGLLLDRYYGTEQGIQADQAHRVARARSKEEKAAVDAVLSEFFTLSDGAWKHSRVEREIEKAQTKIKAAQENGKRGGRPKKNPEATDEKPTGFPLGSDLETQTKAHQTPDTSYSVSNETGGQAARPLTPDEIIFGYGVPLLVGAGNADKAARSFLGGLRKSHGDDRVVDALRECLKAKPLQPLEWLAAKLPPQQSKAPSKHSGFAAKNYREGVNPDGSF